MNRPGIARVSAYFTILMAAVCLPLQVFAEEFRFQYRDGEQYRILSEVQQDVYVNGVFHHSAELLNRIQVSVSGVSDGSGHEEVFYQHSAERTSGPGAAYLLDQEYSADFWRDELGYYDISDEYFVPTVRDVPVFPQRDVQPGETWAADGLEVHDLREGFNIQEVFSFPMPVSYRYVGTVQMDGMELHEIEITYNIYHRKAIPPAYSNSLYPYLITGFSRQTMYFDNVLGRPHSYHEEYEINLQLNDGSTITYSGTAHAEVIESAALDRDALVRDLEQRLDDLGVENSSVRQDERGITISLENIQFAANSATLLPGEVDKLNKIAEILSAYPNNDILVSGHTALAGTARGRQQLSEERAKAVVEYLISLGVKEPANIMYQGFGATVPLADNSTEAGRSRNRRVEITILEN